MWTRLRLNHVNIKIFIEHYLGDGGFHVLSAIHHIKLEKLVKKIKWAFINCTFFLISSFFIENLILFLFHY